VRRADERARQSERMGVVLPVTLFVHPAARALTRFRVRAYAVDIAIWCVVAAVVLSMVR
jgi:hypothetical protein